MTGLVSTVVIGVAVIRDHPLVYVVIRTLRPRLDDSIDSTKVHQRRKDWVLSYGAFHRLWMLGYRIPRSNEWKWQVERGSNIQ